MAKLSREAQELLDKLAPQIRDAFLAAIDSLTDAAEVNRLIAALEAGDVEAAIEALRIEAPFFAPVDQAIGQGFASAGQGALALLRIKDPYSGDAFRLGFDGRHTRAEAWVRDQSSNLIVEVIDQQKEMARDVIGAGLAAGQNPRQVALDIVGRINPATGKREGGFIGLTSQQAAWAKNAEKELHNLDASYFKRLRRDKRFDPTIRAAIESGKPLAAADIRRIITRYRDRLKKYRGDMIGRTEALNSMRAGQWEGFEQLLESGRVRRDQIDVTWSATMDMRTRDHHRHLNGQKVTFGDFFNPAPGVFMRYPGDLAFSTDPKALAAETIQCRCVPIFKITSDLMQGRGDRPKPPALPTPPTLPNPAPAPQPEPENPPPAPSTVAAVGRNAVERRFLAEMDMQGDAAAAFMATTPVTFVSSARGYYVPGDHSIHQRTQIRDAKGDHLHQGRKWIGTFAHEYGHAVDFDGFGMQDFPRSAQMVPDMVLDRADMIAERTLGHVTDDMRAAAAEIGGVTGADRFADLWASGKLTEAIGALLNGLQDEYTARGHVTNREMFLDWYSLHNVLDFIGAVTDLEKGEGHSKGYYRKFKVYEDQAEFFTTGHSTEAFANAFMAFTLARRDFLTALVEQAAPRTIRTFREILKERAKDASQHS